MKKSIAIALILAFCLTASVAFAAPTDVPKNHWAYVAVQELARVGIIDGNGAFNGDRTMTRYEMAKVVENAMANSKKASEVQKALIEKLKIEFALELNKIDTRLAKLEQNQPTVKITGQLLEQFKSKHGETNSGLTGAYGQYRIRINATAKVDDNTTIGVRLANAAPDKDTFRVSDSLKYGDYTYRNTFKADRFFATTNTGITSVTVGRQALEVDPEEVILASAYYSFDGVKAAWKWNNVNIDVKHGRFFRGLNPDTTYGFGPNALKANFGQADVDGINISSSNGKLSWNAGWAKFFNPNPSLANKTLMNYTFADGYYAFADNFTMGAMVGKNSNASAGGKFYMVKGVYGAQSLNATGKQNFTVMYTRAGQEAINLQFTALDQPDESVNGDRFSNLDFAYRYALSKNMAFKLQYSKTVDLDRSNQDYHFTKAQLLYKF